MYKAIFEWKLKLFFQTSRSSIKYSRAEFFFQSSFKIGRIRKDQYRVVNFIALFPNMSLHQYAISNLQIPILRISRTRIGIPKQQLFHKRLCHLSVKKNTRQCPFIDVVRRIPRGAS